MKPTLAILTETMQCYHGVLLDQLRAGGYIIHAFVRLACIVARSAASAGLCWVSCGHFLINKFLGLH
jgi:hypothetical protein